MLKYIRKIQRLVKGDTCYVIGNKSCIYNKKLIVNIQNNAKKIQIGSSTHIRGELLVFAHGGEIDIGDFCYIGENTRVWSALKINIGHHVLISHNCNIFDSNTHPINPYLRHMQFEKIITSGHPRHIDLNESEVSIGNDVWVGAGSSIMKGVKIGECAIVGAGSVVTHHVPAFTIVGGNPAKVIRELTKDELFNPQLADGTVDVHQMEK